MASSPKLFHDGVMDVRPIQRRSPCAARRFPPPWTLDEANDACFIVRDHNGQALAYVYLRG